ncbi:FecCD family ABC transporter permease [Desulfurivibrio alkaliphilus]|uniref:Transport system permease protein n=1 Tax=Desulfurivibrio alkaliphilus (strain DSM 19089 / UNIQEM U267 / AHT2) TaxID=589865 RepID=D6Z3X9_DESAT|nr:iron ABC transporter permease [Desulfurivibrio alkaliphilus]ADH86254.1 transport system permease protein [Desulfurivibrio alkaliphilus AHT 2]
MTTPTFPSLLITLPLVLLGGALALAGAVFLGLSGGSTGLNPQALWLLLTDPAASDPITATIIWEIRLPRVILAAAAGAALALGGLVFQALLRNPLAEPYILGLSGGAAVGAILGMMAGLANFPGVTLLAFAGGMVTLALVLAIAGGRRGTGKDTLLLGGVMMNAFCGSLIMLLLAISQDDQLRSILFWLMGDLSRAEPGQLHILLLLAPLMLLIMLLARPLNLLLMGRDAAATLGVNVGAVSLTLLIATSFMVGVIVSQAGLIGFVGLVVPHIFRLLAGPDHRVLIPACLLGGAAYLVVCDLLARSLPTGGELPVGIVTALIGAPIFIFLLWKTK